MPGQGSYISLFKPSAKLGGYEIDFLVLEFKLIPQSSSGCMRWSSSSVS